MLHFDDISLFTSDETELHPGLLIRKIEVTLENDDAGAETDGHEDDGEIMMLMMRIMRNRE